MKFTRKKYFFSHISSSYTKILGETNFHAREIPQSGSKAKDGEKMAHASRLGQKKREETKRLNDGNNNGQATSGPKNSDWIEHSLTKLGTAQSLLFLLWWLKTYISTFCAFLQTILHQYKQFYSHCTNIIILQGLGLVQAVATWRWH